MVQEKDPKRWDEVIIDSPFAKLTKRDVHEYYSTPAVQKKILDAVGDREAILRQSFTADKTVLRRKDEAGELIRLNKEQLDKWNAKRLSEVHPTFGRKTDVLLADIDPQEGVDWRHTKKITETVAKTMQSRPEVRDVSIRFSGGRGFYVEGKLDAPVGVDHARNLTKRVLDGLAQRHDVYFQPVGPGNIRLDTTPLKNRGSIRAPYSINADTGLVSAPVKLEDLAGAQKKDFSVAKVLERMREKKSQHTLITGRPGSGKTTYLKQLEEQTGLPSIHLDSIPERKAAWEEMMASKKRLEEIENRIVHEALAQKQPHLIEGWQLLNADPKELEPHNRILVEPGYARSMKQFVNRELQRNPKYKLDDLQHRANMLATESKESIKKFRAIPGTKVVQPREKRAAQELYHGSPEKLETLEPKNYHEDPGIPKAVFASPSREFAMAYAGKKWGDRDINQSTRFRDKQRIVTLQENRPGAFDELYKGQPGYLYHVPAEPFEVPHKRTTWEQISRNAVTPTDIETIPDVLAELQRSKGVELLPYEEAAARKAILRRVVRMRQMSPADRQEYVKWWGKKAPPELQPALQEALSKAATVQLPQSLLDEVSKDKWATRAYGQKTLREIKEGKRDVVPIEDKGNIVGFMAPNETKFGYPSTGFVFVSPSSRGKGLAAKVLAEYAKKNPSAISFLHRDNIASQKAHLKAGWEDTGAAARGNPRARVWRVKQAMEKLAAARRKEFAPGIPMNRKIHKIPKVKNPQPWTLAIQKHDANKAGTHFDLRLIPPKGNKAHSWAIPKAKLPKRGVMQLAIQQPTHTKEYATTFSGKIPKGTYGAGKVTMHTNEPVTVLSAGDNRVKFRRASGEQFTLFRTKEKQWGITKTAAEVIDEWRKKKREAKVTAFIRERMR